MKRGMVVRCFELLPLNIAHCPKIYPVLSTDKDIRLTGGSELTLGMSV